METRALAAIMVTAFNAVAMAASTAAEELDKLLAGDGGEASDKSAKAPRRSRAKKEEGDEEDEKPARASRSKKSDEDEDDPVPARRSRAKKVEHDDEDDEDDDEPGDDEPSEDDVVDAVRAAQKVLEREQISRLIKKFGKADKSRDIKPADRKHFLVNLERAVKTAEED